MMSINQWKRMLELAPALLLSALIGSGQALAGGESSGGGGGAQIEAAFRMRGYGLIVKISHEPRAQAYCSTDKIEQALDRSRIRIVDQLIDPTTQKPVGAGLDAWTIPGDIQLLHASWMSLVNPIAYPYAPSGKSVGLLVLHELYRATGICDDEGFRISERVFSLLNGEGGVATPKLSEMFTFDHLYFLAGGTSYDPVNKLFDDVAMAPGMIQGSAADQYMPLACDQDLFAALKTGTEVNCLQISPNQKHCYLLKHLKALVPYGDFARSAVALRVTSGANEEAITDKGVSLEQINQMKHVSTQHPLVVVHDILNGSWSIGLQ